MGYVDQNLIPGEKVLFRTKIHWSSIVFTVISLLFWIVLWFMVAPLALAYIANTMPSNTRGESGVMAANLMITIFFGVVILGLVLSLLLRVIEFFTTEFAVTDKRVLAKMGSIRQRTIELFLTQVEGIMVDQSLLGRLLGYGTLIVTGTGGMKTPFPNIAHADEFRKQVRGNIVPRTNPGGTV
jgi:hypothetical protein